MGRDPPYKLLGVTYPQRLRSPCGHDELRHRPRSGMQPQAQPVQPAARAPARLTAGDQVQINQIDLTAAGIELHNLHAFRHVE